MSITVLSVLRKTRTFSLTAKHRFHYALHPKHLLALSIARDKDVSLHLTGNIYFESTIFSNASLSTISPLSIPTATMKLIAGTTKASATSISGLSLLLFYIVSILQIPVQTDANVLSNKVLPNCDGCPCIQNGTACPELPTISESMIPTFRAMTHVNPIDVLCNPFLSLQCMHTLEQGEACAVELLPPSEPTGSSCPDNYSYR